MPQLPEQYIPEYKTAFMDASWLVRESPHYRFHYFKESLAEREIDMVVETQELAFKKIIAFLEVPPPDKKIAYYLYEDIETKKRLMGNSVYGQAIIKDFAVHALYNEQDRVMGEHEDTHLLSIPFGLAIGFFSEGLAQYMVGSDWYGNDFVLSVKEALGKKGFEVSESFAINHKAWMDTDDETYGRQYYSLAALFTGYLIEHFGKKKYLALYAQLHRNVSDEQNAQAYQDILGTDVKTIFTDWSNESGFN